MWPHLNMDNFCRYLLDVQMVKNILLCYAQELQSKELFFSLLLDGFSSSCYLGFSQYYFYFFGDNVVLFGNVEELVEGKKIVSILSISLRRRFSSKVH